MLMIHVNDKTLISIMLIYIIEIIINNFINYCGNII